MPDADGDGREDLLVGAVSEDESGVYNAGRAYLFSGATGVPLHTLTSLNPEYSGNFGYSVPGAPDVNGDGWGDLLVGAISESYWGNHIGRTYLFSGATGTVLGTLQIPNIQEFGAFGCAVSGVPDADGDGHGDLLIGAHGEDGGGEYRAGRVYLFSGALAVASVPDPETPALGLSVAPNPARGRAVFTLSLPQAGPVRLSVHDVLGREVTRLVDGPVAAGAHTAVFDARGPASGVYVWRLASGGSVQAGRLTLLE